MLNSKDSSLIINKFVYLRSFLLDFLRMIILNNFIGNDILFYGMCAGVVCHFGIFLYNSIPYGKKEYTETGVQTDAVEVPSDKPSQIIQENIPSIDTLSPVTSTIKNTSSVIPTTSEVGTQTIFPPVNIEGVPTPDIARRVIDPSNAEYIATKVAELNALDPFVCSPWTPEKVSGLIDQIMLFHDLFN